MKKISISYNPYLFKTSFVFQDRKDFPKQLAKYLETPFDEIVEDIVSELYDILNVDYLINFKGRISEFEELEYEVNEFNKKNKRNIELNHEIKIDDDNSIKDIKRIFEKIQNGPFEDLKSKEIIDGFEKAIKKSEFNIGVIATMKAGKSTFLNSLLANKILPTKSEACTAKVFYIHDKDDMNNFNAKSYDKMGNEISSKNNITDEDMKKYNDESDKISYVKIYGNIQKIRSRYKDLVMIDTPGPNNASDKSHFKVTYEFLEDDVNSIVLYIIDATISTSEDNYIFFKNVAELMKEKGKKSNERFIFVLNKIDEYDIEKDDNIAEKINSFKKEWEKEYGIKNPNIFPATAYFALISRMKLNNSNKLSTKENQALNNEYLLKHLGPEIMKSAPVNSNIRRKLDLELKEAQKNKNINQQMSLMSGIPAIENYIDSFLDKYSRPLMIHDAMDSFYRELKLKDVYGKMLLNINEKESRREQILSEIEKINSEIKFGDNANTYKQKIQSIIINPNLKEKIKNFLKKSDDLKNSVILKCQSGGNIGKSTGDKLIKDFSEELKKLFGDWDKYTKNAYSVEIQGNFKNLYDEYRSYAKKLISNSIDIQNDETFMKDLLFIDVKSDQEIIKALKTYSETYQVKVDKKSIFNPTRWLGEIFSDDKFIYNWEERNREVYNSEELVKKLISEFIPINKKLVLFEDKMENSLEYYKTLFSKEIDSLELKITEKLKSLEILIKDEGKIKKAIEEHEVKKKWLDNIVEEMDTIFYLN